MTTPGYQRFFAELKRRRVFRVMAVYGIVGFVLLQIVDLAVPALLLPEWTYRLVALFLLLGFPVAIVLAWAFESTPEGIKRTEEAAPGELGAILAAPASQRWPAGVAALVGVTALLGGVWYMGRQSAPASNADVATSGPVAASIAVLPFVNMSDDASNEYFSDGISEELLNLLAKIPELQVTSRSSAFSYKGQDVKLADVARELNVAHILEGSVRKSDTQVRITAQLIDARSDTHLWSRTWDRTLDDIFAIQDEIAADVVAQLQITLLGAAPTVAEIDPEAYALFLQARQTGRLFTEEGFERSNALYEQALEIEPEYAAAWTGLSFNNVVLANVGMRPLDEGYRLAREAANRALAIDPDYAPAHAIFGRIASNHDNDLAAAARHIERALELDPTNPEILDRASSFSASLGRLDQSIALSEYVVAHDPLGPNARFRLGNSYVRVGRLDEAIESYRAVLSLIPGGGVITNFALGEALLLDGELDEALQAMQQEVDEGWRWIGMPMAYHALGRAEESDTALAELIDKDEQAAAYNIAYVLAFRGETDRAFEWLDKAVEYNDPGLSGISTEPLFANIHDDPRWLPFLESIGKSPQQLAAIEFEVRVPQ